MMKAETTVPFIDLEQPDALDRGRSIGQSSAPPTPSKMRPANVRRRPARGSGVGRGHHVVEGPFADRRVVGGRLAVRRGERSAKRAQPERAGPGGKKGHPVSLASMPAPGKRHGLVRSQLRGPNFCQRDSCPGL